MLFQHAATVDALLLGHFHSGLADKCVDIARCAFLLEDTAAYHFFRADPPDHYLQLIGKGSTDDWLVKHQLGSLRVKLNNVLNVLQRIDEDFVL